MHNILSSVIFALSLSIYVGLQTFTKSGHFCTGFDCFLCSKLFIKHYPANDQLAIFIYMYLFLLTGTLPLLLFFSPPPSHPFSPPSLSSLLTSFSLLTSSPLSLSSLYPLFSSLYISPYLSSQTCKHHCISQCYYLTVGKWHGSTYEWRPVASHQVIMIFLQVSSTSTCG